MADVDYSKLSTEDLLALKQGDYSKVSTEGLMYLKGQGNGSAQQPGFWQSAKQQLGEAVDAVTPNFVKGGLMFANATGMPMSPSGVPDYLAQKAGNAIADIPVQDPAAATAKGVAAGVVANAPDIGRAAMGVADAPEMAEGLTNMVKAPVNAAKRVINAFNAPSSEELKMQQELLQSSFKPTVDAAREKGIAGIRAAQDTLDRQKFAAQQIALQRQQQIRSAVDAARTEGEQTLAPLRQGVTDLKSQMYQLPVQQKAAQAAGEEALRAAGTQMGEAETAAGFPSDAQLAVKTARRAQNPELLSKVMQKFGPDFEQGPDAIIQKGYSPKTIQAVRKLFENQDVFEGSAKGVGNTIRINAAQALEKLDPEGFGVARQNYLSASRALDELPTQFAAKKAALQTALLQANDALGQAQDSLNNTLKAVQESQREAVNAATRSQRLTALQNTFKARQELTAAKRQLQDLVAQAKVADASKLADIEAQGRALLQEGLKNSRIRTKAVRLGYLGAGAAGIGGTYHVLRTLFGHGD